MRDSVLVFALLALSGSASGCGSSDGALGESPTLFGQFRDFNGGSDKRLVASTLTGVMLSSTPIAADGSFSITLPGKDAFTSGLDETTFEDPCTTQNSATKTIVSCESNIQPKTAHRAVLQLSIPGFASMISQDARETPQNPDFPPAAVAYEYWVEPVEFNAKLVFREQQTQGLVTVQNQWELHLKPGWNSTITYQPTAADVANGIHLLRFASERPSSSFAWYCCTF